MVTVQLKPQFTHMCTVHAGMHVFFDFILGISEAYMLHVSLASENVANTCTSHLRYSACPPAKDSTIEVASLSN